MADPRWYIKEKQVVESLVGRTIAKAEYDMEQEGAVLLTFTDGSKFYVTASGDDATHIQFGLE